MQPSNIAIFDPKAFYPFRSLVQGNLHNWNELKDIERFVRAIVLHDEMLMILSPWPFDPRADEEIEQDGHEVRSIIVAMGPVLDDYDGLLGYASNLKPIPEKGISSNLREVAVNFSNAGPGNPYYEAHIEFIGKILAVLKNGGSIVCNEKFAHAMELKARDYPKKLFEVLDKDWQTYAMAIEEGLIGAKIPPILSIILTRCKNREDIPEVLNQLRQEWSDARKNLWKSLGELRKARTLKEAHQIRRQLDEASTYFSPLSQQISFSPMRVFWDIFAESSGGAIDSALGGGNPVVGAISASGRKVLTYLAKDGKQFGKRLFGRGAFDLANRVRKEIMNSNAKTALSNLLTKGEKEALGL